MPFPYLSQRRDLLEDAYPGDIIQERWADIRFHALREHGGQVFSARLVAAPCERRFHPALRIEPMTLGFKPRPAPDSSWR